MTQVRAVPPPRFREKALRLLNSGLLKTKLKPPAADHLQVAPGARTTPRNGAARVVENLQAHGVEHVVMSALGSTEHTLGRTIREAAVGAGLSTSIVETSGQNAKLETSRYFVEAPAVSEAVGYNQAANGPKAVLFTHSTPGTFNSLGHLWDALHKNGVPLVVICGEADATHVQKHMYGDIVGAFKGTMGSDKFARKVTDLNDIDSAFDDAFDAVNTPGHGPALLVLPQSIMAKLQAGGAAPVAPRVNTPRIEFRAELAAGTTTKNKAQAFDALAENFADPEKKWAIVVGDGVKRSDAAKEISELAGKIGAQILGGNTSLSGNFVHGDLMVSGNLGHMQSEGVRKQLSEFDGVLFVGTPPNSYVFDNPAGHNGHDNPVEGKSVVTISASEVDLARTKEMLGGQTANLLVLGDEKEAIQSLLTRLDEPEFQAMRKAGATRTQSIKAANRAAATKNELGLLASQPFQNLWSRILSRTINHLAPNAVIHNEAITNSAHQLAMDRFGDRDTSDDQNTLGGALGTWPQVFGMARKLGRVALAFVGDYGFLETAGGIRAAAEGGLKTGIVVMDNGGGAILKGNGNQLDGEPYNPQPHADIYSTTSPGVPDIDYAQIARGHGMEGSVRVDDPTQFVKAASALVSSAVAGRPMLVHLKIPPAAINTDHSRLATWVPSEQTPGAGELRWYNVKDALTDPKFSTANIIPLSLENVAQIRFNEQQGLDLIDRNGDTVGRLDRKKLDRYNFPRLRELLTWKSGPSSPIQGARTAGG